jgi:hypothetical protein
MTTLKPGDRVYFDNNSGTVTKVNAEVVEIKWSNGLRSTERVSDLLTVSEHWENVRPDDHTDHPEDVITGYPDHYIVNGDPSSCGCIEHGHLAAKSPAPAESLAVETKENKS